MVVARQQETLQNNVVAKGLTALHGMLSQWPIDDQPWSAAAGATSQCGTGLPHARLRADGKACNWGACAGAQLAHVLDRELAVVEDVQRKRKKQIPSQKTTEKAW